MTHLLELSLLHKGCAVGEQWRLGAEVPHRPARTLPLRLMNFPATRQGW